MEFACLRCHEHVHVALGVNAPELAEKTDQRRLESEKRQDAAKETSASDQGSAAVGTQSVMNEVEGENKRVTVEQSEMTRCRRCDGLFHTKCMVGDGEDPVEFECSACGREDLTEEDDGSRPVETMPLLVPVQVLGVLKNGDETMASDDEDEDDGVDWDELVVFTEDIRVCTTCRQVHLAAEDLAPCAHCGAVGRLHGRCAETAPSVNKSPGRKRKRSGSKTTGDLAAAAACASCIGETAVGAVTTRRLALLKKPEERQWWETCVTCHGEFCLHALVSDESEDDEELRSRLGRDTDAGFQCLACSSMPSIRENASPKGAVELSEPVPAVASGVIYDEMPAVEEDEETVLICDGCDGEFDMASLDPPLLEVPEGDWFCPTCHAQRIEPVVTEVVVTLLICDGCEGEFELSPSETVPDGDWFCNTCVQSQQAPPPVSVTEPEQEQPATVTEDPEVAAEDVPMPAAEDTSAPDVAPPATVTDLPAESDGDSVLPSSGEANGSVDAGLIECDGCDDKYDVNSIGPVSPDVPKGDWFCNNCEATRKRRKKGYAAMKMEKLRRLRAMGDERAISLALEVAKQQLPRQVQVQPVKKVALPARRQASLGPPLLAPVTLLICDGCEGEFDMVTLNPPLASIPKGDWFCSGCAGHANSSNRRKLAASAACSSCAVAVRWDRNAQRAASRHGGVVLCEPCAQRKAEAKALQSASEAEKKRKRDSYLQPHDGRVNVDPSERIFVPVPVSVSYGTATTNGSSSSTATGNISAYGNIVCSDDESGDGLHGHSDDDEEHVIIVCEICLSEFNMIDVLGESHIAPPRPWYCTPCVKRLKKNRKKKQRISKQMMLEMQLYGGLLRPTAAKFVDPISRALRGKKPNADEELLALLELVGKRVGVMLSWDKHWVMGRVLAFDPATCVHIVRFVDESERSLPLFAFPIVIGTGTIMEVKVPASQNLWWPAEVLKMNAIAERQLEQSLEDASVLKAFRLVNLFEATTVPGKPSNVACWTPRHLCRSLTIENPAASPEQSSDYEQAKRRAVDDSQETSKILRASFGALLRKAHDSSDSEEVWHAVAQAIVGSSVVVCQIPCECFKVEAFDVSSGRHRLIRTGDEADEGVDINLLDHAGRVELEDSRSLAKVELVLYKAQRGIFESDTNADAEDGDEITIVQSTSVSIRPAPASSSLQCDKCGLPPVVDGDGTVSARDASLVECVKCRDSFHSYCCDPPHDAFPLVSSEDGGAVLVNDIQTPFVCRKCVTCAGCDAATSIRWFRWRLPLQVVTLCEHCIRVYDDKCQCAVCNTAIEETMQDESPSLLKCSACDLWVHPLCEPDPHPAFRRRLHHDTQDFELDIHLPLPDLNASHVDDDDEEYEEVVVGKKSRGSVNNAAVAAKSARLIEEDFAFDLKFKDTYDARVLHNYECLTCRKVRMLRVLYRLRLEDKLDLFKEPVTKTIAPTYFDVIKQPMDLSTMQRKVLEGTYKRVNFRDFRDDFELLCLNAVTFNSRDRDFLIWREAWRFYGQGQRVLRQVVPKSRMKQRGGKNYDALVLAAKRQLPNNAHAGKSKGEIGGDDVDDGDDGEDDDDEMDEDGGGDEAPDAGTDENGDVGGPDASERDDGDKMADQATTKALQVVNGDEASAPSAVGANSTDGSASTALVKTTFERKRAPQLAVGPTFTPQNELGSVPKPHSSYSFYVTMHSRSSSHAYAWIDVCGHCGTRGSPSDLSEHLVFCIDCGEGFHSFCAGVDEQRLLSESSQLQSYWRCKNCEMCELCGKPHDHVVKDEDDEAKWMVCSHCDRSFHGKCLLPAISAEGDPMNDLDDSGRRNDSFYCANCVHCKNCGKAASPASYSFERELCLNCCHAQKSEQSLLSEKTKGLLQVWTSDARKQRKDAEKCPMCRLKWTVEDTDLVQCDACECWAHPLCDPVFVEDPAKYDTLVQDPNAQYVCAVCRGHNRDHLSEIPEMAKCQLFLAKIQRTRSLCDARWKEAQTQMRQAQKWQEWKENVAIYLYVLRIGEECVKGLAYRSVNFQDDWTRITSSKYKDLDVPAWLLHKASRYLRYKRYARGPRAATRKLTRKNENFYSQQGVERQKEPHAIATIAAQASSCAALVVCVHLLYRWSPLQRVVFHLLEREGHAHGQRLSHALIKALLVDNNETLEDEIATIKKQYERRAGNKHLLRLQADDDDEMDGQQSEISPTGSSVSSLALETTSVETTAAPATQDADAVEVTTTAVVVREPVRLTRAPVMHGAGDDSRFCYLCFIVGETPACGRLIYVELDQWVHLNCALWSAEVYEDTAGVLHKCQKALSRSKTNRCDGCGVLGATIGCAVSRCQRHYHFPCALDHGVVFLPTSETCCPMPAHVQQIAKRMEVPELTNMAWAAAPAAETVVASVSIENVVKSETDGTTVATDNDVDEGALAAPVETSSVATEVAVAVTAIVPPTLVLSSMIKAPRRCLRVDFSSIFGDTKKRMNALHLKRQVGFRVGSLTVHSLGHVVIGNPSFYSREAVFPLGFRSTRIYWSSRAIATRCVYECVVTSTDVEARSKSKGAAKNESKPETSSPKALFKITASDDVENPIVAASPTEALLELRSRIIALYEEATGSDNPFLRRRSWFSYGLLGHHFFGFGIPEIAREIETLPHVATTAIRRSYVLHRHRQQLQASRKRRRGQDLELVGDESKFGDHVYVFSHRLPSATEMSLAMREVEQVVEAEEHARISTGAVRTDGLEREEVDEAEAAAIMATRRRLNKDATRDSQVQLPSEKTGAPSNANATASSNIDAATNASSSSGGDVAKDKQGVSMDLEHLPIAMQYRELRRRPFSERLEVRKSKIHGYGLFTKDKFVEGGMIVEYQGQMISQDVADVREKQYEEQGIGSCYMFRLDERTIIDATRCGNLARFMNHSCDPKAFARVVTVENNEKKIVIFAKRTIEAGEEVTYDYKFPIEDEAIRCDCGAPNCIGRMN